MSKYEQKDLEGVLFANKEKVKETDANAKGSALIDGVEYRVNAWTNTSKAGEKYQKLSFIRKKQQAAPSPVEPVQQEMPDDSGIPF
jgi:hypothetical protein